MNHFTAMADHEKGRVMHHREWPPIGAPATLNNVNSSNCCSSNNTTSTSSVSVLREDQHGTHFDNSVNAVSFGFVATAILISMFLLMAIFEKFLRPAAAASTATTSGDVGGRRRRQGGFGGGGQSHDIESQLHYTAKLGYSSPKMTVYANGVSVLMPGDDIPTFIAHPAPVACPREKPMGSRWNSSSIPQG